MQDIIDSYLKSSFSDELQDQIQKTFDLFDKFQLQGWDLDLSNLLMTEAYIDRDQLYNSFLGIINVKVALILDNHTVKLSEEATLGQKNEIMSALYLIQDLSDYSTIINVLESDLDKFEKLADVLGQLCVLTPTDIMTLVEDVNEAIIDRLKEFVYQKEGSDENSHDPESIIPKMYANLKRFTEFAGERMIAGAVLVRSGVKAGYELDLYLPFIAERLEMTDVEQVSYDIISTLMLTPEGFNSVALSFKKHSNILFHDINLISKVDVKINDIMMQFDRWLIKKTGE